MLCTKAGTPKGLVFDSLEESPVRRSNFKVTNCKACIRLRPAKDRPGFELYEFFENHNHGLISSDNMDLSRKKRRLDFADQEYIVRCRKANVGPTKAHRLQVALKGGHHMVRGTKTDYKNFSRDVTKFIGNRDAQMFVDIMSYRSKQLENFTFKCKAVSYEVRGLFWADDVAKSNYKVFGDVLAFDATYQTNRYNMIFVPFTGVDHHKKCVTFGAGLLYNETVDSYIWLLKAFISAHEKQPTLVLTDQDAAMKKAVNMVFDKSIHRLCMWHITNKIPKKVCGNAPSNLNLRNAIHKLVWNVYLKPSTFESRWKSLMESYHLEEHEWLSGLYSIREQWVRGYFRDIPMCCLMKTTSRCESSNSLFKVTSSASNSLVEFLHCFDNAIDGQRCNQRHLEYSTTTTTPQLRTSLLIERHADEIYTRSIFKDVQKEIFKSTKFCYIANRQFANGIHTYSIAHQDNRCDIINEFMVKFNLDSNTVTCSCMGYTRIGYLCRHVFCFFRHHKIEKIPHQYVHDRCRRNALPRSVFSFANRYCADQTESSITRHRIVDNIQQVVDRVHYESDRLSILDQHVQQLKDAIFKEYPYEHSNHNKGVVIQEVSNLPDPKNIKYTIPLGIRNKGCGTNRRLIGPGEKAIARSKKAKRKCRYCGKLVNDHDSRNCPVKKKDMEATSSSDNHEDIVAEDELPEDEDETFLDEDDNEQSNASENDEGTI